MTPTDRMGLAICFAVALFVLLNEVLPMKHLKGRIIEEFESNDTNVSLRHIKLQTHDDDKIHTVVILNFDTVCVIEFDTRAHAAGAYKSIVTATLSRRH